MKLRTVTPPATEPVSVDEIKLALSIDGTERDMQLASSIEAARALVEEYTNRALITQTLETALDAWPAELVELPRPVLQSVISATAYDADGGSSVVDSSVYEVDVFGEPGGFARRVYAEWPVSTLRSSSGLVIRYVAGYGDDPDDVPRPLRDAIIETVRAMIDSDTDWTHTLPPLALGMAKPYRVRPI